MAACSALAAGSSIPAHAATVVRVSEADAVPGCYFEELGPGRFRSTRHAQGAWATDQVHMAPLSGLLVDALERAHPRPDMVISRVAFDILGVIRSGELTVDTRILRPGRTIELLEADLIGPEGRIVVHATAWRLGRLDTAAVAGHHLTGLPDPLAGDPVDVAKDWAGGYIRSVQFRTAGPRRSGRGSAWLTPNVPLLDSRPVSDLARLMGLVDTANGIAIRAMPDEVVFPNVDLTVHLFRQPTGNWLGLDTDVSFGVDGTGITASVLHDSSGPFGRAAQALTVRPVQKV